MYTQENRLLELVSPLGPDVLLLTEFEGSEGVSTLFQYQLAMISENRSINFEEIIGQEVSVLIRLADGTQRVISGLIISFCQVDSGENENAAEQFSRYTAVMAPWTWLLTQTADLRIFQELSVPEILEKIFQEKEFNDFTLKLHDKYEKKNYCVQYRETDFNFISRLMEEEGIFYFFTHEPGIHTMIITDSPSEHQVYEDHDIISYELDRGGLLAEDVITSLEFKKHIRAGKITINDYNFETPATRLKVEVSSRVNLGPGERELYDYPAEYGKRQEGDRLANIRMQTEEAQITSINGRSTCRTFSAGQKFTLEKYYRDEMNGKSYVLTGVNHSASQSGYRSGSAEAKYSNAFTCIPHEVPYRPLGLTPRPVVEGVQTAIVVGPAGEEIYTDKHGRIKVQFHWDREGKADENSTCWMRVSQAMAGNLWGTMFLPRIGHEVIVDFIEGDPDRPIITGQVYHGTNTPPYPLPENKTISTFKSNTSPDNGGFNEIRFEDKSGEEQIYIHGEKRLDIRIKEDRFESIGNDRNLVVENDKKEHVKNDRHEVVDVNHKEEIGADRNLTVSGKQLITIGGNSSLTVGGDLGEDFGGNHSETVGANYYVKAGGNIVLEAGSNITLKVGGNYIAIDSSGVSINAGGIVDIKGSMIKLN